MKPCSLQRLYLEPAVRDLTIRSGRPARSWKDSKHRCLGEDRTICKAAQMLQVMNNLHDIYVYPPEDRGN